MPARGDQELCDAIVAECGWMLTEADDTRDEEDELTCQEALTQIVHEADLSEVPEHLGYLYGYALEATCGYLGKHVGEMHGD